MLKLVWHYDPLNEVLWLRRSKVFLKNGKPIERCVDLRIELSQEQKADLSASLALDLALGPDGPPDDPQGAEHE